MYGINRMNELFIAIHNWMKKVYCTCNIGPRLFCFRCYEIIFLSSLLSKHFCLTKANFSKEVTLSHFPSESHSKLKLIFSCCFVSFFHHIIIIRYKKLKFKVKWSVKGKLEPGFDTVFWVNILWKSK